MKLIVILNQVLKFCVSLCVREWIETRPPSFRRFRLRVSLCVREWIETSITSIKITQMNVSLCVREWIETYSFAFAVESS